MSEDVRFRVITNIEQLNDKLSRLDIFKQKKAIEAGLRMSSRLILQKAESNFIGVRKGYYVKNYESYKTLSKIRSKRIISDKIGVLAGLMGSGSFKYRSIQWGTSIRLTKDKASKGSVKKTNFFFRAVDEVRNQVLDSIIENINSVLDKYIKKEFEK